MAVDAVGTGTAGATNRAIGTGATVFRTGVSTTLGLQVGAIPEHIGGIRPRSWGNPYNNARVDLVDDSTEALNTTTDRAPEAVETAEQMDADEMGGTLA